MIRITNVQTIERGSGFRVDIDETHSVDYFWEKDFPSKDTLAIALARHVKAAFDWLAKGDSDGQL